MCFFTGFLTAGLTVMAGTSLGTALRPMSCERGAALEQSYVQRYDKACTKQQSRVKTTQAKIDSYMTALADTTLSAKAKKKLGNSLSRSKRSIENLQKRANRDCDGLVKSQTRLDALTAKCKASPTS